MRSKNENREHVETHVKPGRGPICQYSPCRFWKHTLLLSHKEHKLCSPGGKLPRIAQIQVSTVPALADFVFQPQSSIPSDFSQHLAIHSVDRFPHDETMYQTPSNVTWTGEEVSTQAYGGTSHHNSARIPDAVNMPDLFNPMFPVMTPVGGVCDPPAPADETSRALRAAATTRATKYLG